MTKFQVGDRVIVNYEVVVSWRDRIGWRGTVFDVTTGQLGNTNVHVRYDAEHYVREAVHNPWSLSLLPSPRLDEFIGKPDTEYYSAITENEPDKN